MLHNICVKTSFRLQLKKDNWVWCAGCAVQLCEIVCILAGAATTENKPDRWNLSNIKQCLSSVKIIIIIVTMVEWKSLNLCDVMDADGALRLNSGWVQAQNMHNKKFGNRSRFLGTRGGDDKTFFFFFLKPLWISWCFYRLTWCTRLLVLYYNNLTLIQIVVLN